VPALCCRVVFRVPCRSSKLWAFYADLEESLGTLESACAVYDKMLELKVATPQIILNYALMLQVRPAEPVFHVGRCGGLVGPACGSFNCMAALPCTHAAGEAVCACRPYGG
jgi:hypothetical protein